MRHPEGSVVLKYCEAIDEFFKLRVFTEDESIDLLLVEKAPSKREYVRLVIEHCVVDYEETVLPKIRQMHGECEIESVEEVLYRICVNVNPHLEIHQVSLPLSGGDFDFEDEPRPQPTSQRISRGFQKKIAGLESALNERIIGQEEAISGVSAAIKKAAIGLRDPQKPIGAFLLVGQTGTGKTELAKALADYLFDDPHRLVRIDCSEYSMPHEYAKLIGAPPGYIGHNDGGFLTEAVKERPNCVVLFDELEKAHQKVHNLLLQVLDEGFLTDSKGMRVLFSKSIILMTSNLGVEQIQALRNRIGYGGDERSDYADRHLEATTFDALRDTFRPEFINRIDDIVIFNALKIPDCVKIARRMLGEVSHYLSPAKIQLDHTPKVAAVLARDGFSEEYGARELRRHIKRVIEDPITDRILTGKIQRGSRVRLEIRSGKVRILSS
ncbi:MAG: AAA family ATPase [Planctomycetota bacterium]